MNLEIAFPTVNVTNSLETVDQSTRSIFVENILEWNATKARQFPWRFTRDPFTVLIAELMLQRTQASQAAEILVEFLGRYPDPEAVMRENNRVVESLLSGLGLHHRCRRILDLCRALVDLHGGQVPSNPEELSALPGVGPYTVNAVLCFAFGRDVAIVDQNVVRVLTRVFGLNIQSARPRNDGELWSFASSLLPIGLAREYHFGLLDLAAAVCVPRTNHQGCPMIDICRYFQRSESNPEILIHSG